MAHQSALRFLGILLDLHLYNNIIKQEYNALSVKCIYLLRACLLNPYPIALKKYLSLL